MIIKSIIFISIALSMLHLQGLAAKFDDAIFKSESGKAKSAYAAGELDLKLPLIAFMPKLKANAPKPYINARHYLLADLNTGSELVKFGEKDQVPIASTTKLMTAYIIMTNYKLNDVVTVSLAASTQVGADTYLRPGEKITVAELLHCMLIKSGNDAAYALAEHLSGDTGGVAPFVTKMNETALSFGMKNSDYRDPAGLDVTGYSSATDLFTITKKDLTFPFFREIVKEQSYVAKNIDGTIFHQLDNSNRLVTEYQYPGAIGVKTGYMPEAGHCLVSAAERNGHTLVGVVLSTYLDTPSASADESRKLLDFGFENTVFSPN